MASALGMATATVRNVLARRRAKGRKRPVSLKTPVLQGGFSEFRS